MLDTEELALFILTVSRNVGFTDAVAWTLIISLFAGSIEVVKVLRSRDRNRVRNRQYALDEMDKLTEREFKRMFRMSRRCFDVLEERLIDYYGDDFDTELHRRRAEASSGSVISMRTRLAVTLRWLAGGSYTDICFIGDEAFVNTQQFLVPWSGRGLDPWKDSFNYHLSSMRQCIERSFSHLTQRWGIFWRPLQCGFDKWTLVCTVTAKLHNYIIDMGEGGDNDMPVGRAECDIDDGDACLVYLNGNFNEDEELLNTQRPSGDRRRQLTQYLHDEGVRRPSLF